MEFTAKAKWGQTLLEYRKKVKLGTDVLFGNKTIRSVNIVLSMEVALHMIMGINSDVVITNLTLYQYTCAFNRRNWTFYAYLCLETDILLQIKPLDVQVEVFEDVAVVHEDGVLLGMGKSL